VRADAPTEEIPKVWDAVPEAPRHEPEFHQPAPAIPDEEAVTCLTEFQARGRQVGRASGCAGMTPCTGQPRVLRDRDAVDGLDGKD